MSDIRPTSGMGVLFRKKSRVKDETTSSLVKNGVYHLADTYDDEEAKKFSGPAPYGFWSAVKYTFTLSLLLWWLPVFGQMIAGYVGGRRAGTPWKGMLAALIPVIVFAIVSLLVKVGIIPTIWFGVDVTPSAVLSVITTQVPVVDPYLDFVSMYLHNFFASLQTTATLGLDSYIITVAFAYIGGVLSQQTRRELELIAKLSAGNKTTVVLEGNTFTQAPGPHHGHKGRGFEDLESLGAMDEEEGQTPLRSASRMLYDEEEAATLSLKDRKALRARAQSMAHEQRAVEKKVQKRIVEEEREADRPAPRKGKDGRDSSHDWEFI